MAKIPLPLNAPIVVNPGDSLVFFSTSSSTQFHFAVTPPSSNLMLGVWKGEKIPKVSGVAMSKPGLSYVDHVTGVGQFEITIDGATQPFTVTATANSWWTKVFGW